MNLLLQILDFFEEISFQMHLLQSLLQTRLLEFTVFFTEQFYLHLLLLNWLVVF